MVINLFTKNINNLAKKDNHTENAIFVRSTFDEDSGLYLPLKQLQTDTAFIES